jgi:hypothetical protein
MEEIWKDIPGYEGLYKVSSLGRVLSLNYNSAGISKIMKGSIKRGYLIVELYKDRISKRFSVHRLVTMTFLPIPENLKRYIGTRILQVNHIDENKTNNSVDNLEWCTASYNLSYGTRPRRVLDSHKASGSSRAEKQVCQYDPTGNFIRKYISAHAAARDTKLDFSKIAMCARKERNMHGGFLWCYASDTERIKEIESLRTDSSPKLF